MTNTTTSTIQITGETVSELFTTGPTGEERGWVYYKTLDNRYKLYEIDGEGEDFNHIDGPAILDTIDECKEGAAFLHFSECTISAIF